jgi:hypothetical protein
MTGILYLLTPLVIRCNVYVLRDTCLHVMSKSLHRVNDYFILDLFRSITRASLADFCYRYC